MAEYIDREAVIKAIEFNKGVGCSDRCVQGIKYIPAADVVEVVRCKDCKYLNSDIAMGEWEGSCRYWNTHSVMLNDFCSYGERKEG